MVSNVSAGSKKCPPNIRTPSVHSPVLVSPISVAHRNKMLDNEGGNKSNSNWMRDQWVANLKKKQLNGGNGVVPGVQVTSSVVPSRGSGANTGGRATKSGGRNNSRRNNNSNNSNSQQQQQQQQQQHLTIPPLNNHSFGEKDNLGLTHPAMFFNDLGCFEIESQSFTHLTPSTQDFDHLLSTPGNGGSLIGNSSYSVNPQPPVTTTTTTKNRGGGSQKKNVKPLPKKRTKCSALDVNQPKPRTPRRKLNCGNAFEDYQDHEVFTSSSSSTPQCFSSVGTPSNFNTEVSRMWGHDLDFNIGSYVDTFLDLPTPKSAEMPTTMGLQSQQQQQYQSSSSVHLGAPPPPSSSRSAQQHLDDDLGLPKLIRTTSIEQEGLSYFFEQTTLGGAGDNSSSSSSHNSTSDLYQMPRQQQQHHHHQIKKNQIDLGASSSASGSYSHAAMGAVDECFSKMMPSPHAPRRNSLLGSTAASQFNTLNRLLSSTPRNGQGGQSLRTPRGPNGEYNFDHKNMPEFETLLDEYKFTDIDQELDSFYLDTIESFGGDLDLISN